jgi:hypothetical protein
MPRTLTNKRGLPLPLFLAIRNDQYEARGHISTTTLIDSPYVRALKKYNHYEEDASDGVWALMGQAIHSVIERVGASFEGREFKAEEKLMIKTTGIEYKHEVEVSGTSDLIEIPEIEVVPGGVILHDFKNVFVYVAKQGVASPAYKKWTMQLNIYRYMIKECLGLEVTDIFVHAFIRDWNRNRSEYTEGYPEYPVETFSVPVYSHKSILEFIKRRIDLHFITEEKYRTGRVNEVPVCEPEDRWARPEIWKMLKFGGKRSLKNFVIKDDADRLNAKAYFTQKSQEVKELTIKVEPGEDVRCVNYCAVNKFCSYYKETYVKENKEQPTVREPDAPAIQEPDEPKAFGIEFKL